MEKSMVVLLIFLLIVVLGSFVSLVEVVNDQSLLRFCVSIGMIILSLVLVAFVLSNDTGYDRNTD